MDDMHAFETTGRRSGPPGRGRTFASDDVATVVAAMAATDPLPASGGSTLLFSATKFVIAAVIVALFGGFLLAGLLTQQPSEEAAPPAAATATSDATDSVRTSVRSDLLPGVALVVEEVEPGVFRVLSDGVRDIVSPGGLRRDVDRGGRLRVARSGRRDLRDRRRERLAAS